jgi:hypothetical protein
LAAAEANRDFFGIPEGLFFGFGVAESSSSDFDLAGVLDGFGFEPVFFFFGEAVGVGDGDL